MAWEEYRLAHLDGYRYSRFCELYQKWRRRLDVVLRQEHPAGEQLDPCDLHQPLASGLCDFRLLNVLRVRL